MKTLSYDKLCQLSREALASPRLRMNSNFHPQLSDPIQRLAIAMEPGTYIRPHRHSATWELLSPLRGRFVVLTFDDAGQVSQRAVLGEDRYAAGKQSLAQPHDGVAVARMMVAFVEGAGAPPA